MTYWVSTSGTTLVIFPKIVGIWVKIKLVLFFIEIWFLGITVRGKKGGCSCRMVSTRFR